MIESKGVDPIRMRNFLRVDHDVQRGLGCSGRHGRASIFCSRRGSSALKTNDYFAEMDEELNNGGRERLLHDLLTFDLSTGGSVAFRKPSAARTENSIVRYDR